MSMESGETEAPSRLSRRLAQPEASRIRSKTPIMGKNVPRLARHHSEELLLGFDKIDNNNNNNIKINNITSPLPPISRGRSIEATYKPTNHHRTASLRRRQKKKKHSNKHKKNKHSISSSNSNSQEKRSSESSDKPNVLDLAAAAALEEEMDMDGGIGDGIDDVSIVSVTSDNNMELTERRESDSVKANVTNEIMESLMNNNNKEELSLKKEVIRIEVIPDEYEEYKTKSEVLSQEVLDLEKKLIEKVNECNRLKAELNYYKNSREAELMAHIEKLLGDVENEEEEEDTTAGTVGEGVNKNKNKNKMSGGNKRRQDNRNLSGEILINDMADTDTCVMFGLKLF